MNGMTIYPCTNNAAVRYAGHYLADRGVDVTLCPGEEVTHLLLPVPSFDANGSIRGGGNPARILGELPADITVIGGNLNHPLLERYPTIDLLKDPLYLAENAAITADCAIRIAGANLAAVFRGCPMLIIGWGRIGKCLARSLRDLGADVTVAARKDEDLAILHALGYRTERSDRLHFGLSRYRVIFNTVPAPVMSENQVSFCRPDCVLIELASKPGIAGDRVIRAGGLPGKEAPESSGILIGKSILRLIGRRDPA